MRGRGFLRCPLPRARRSRLLEPLTDRLLRAGVGGWGAGAGAAVAWGGEGEALPILRLRKLLSKSARLQNAEESRRNHSSRRVVLVSVDAPSVCVGVSALPTAATSLPPETTFQLSHLQSQNINIIILILLF